MTTEPIRNHSSRGGRLRRSRSPDLGQGPERGRPPTCTFTPFAMPATRWRQARVQVSARRNVRGHSSSCAALICQHATQERDEAIAAGMGKLLRQARRKAKRTGERARIL